MVFPAGKNTDCCLHICKVNVSAGVLGRGAGCGDAKASVPWGGATSGWDLPWSTGASSLHFEANPHSSLSSVAIIISTAKSEAEFCVCYVWFSLYVTFFPPVLLPCRCRKLLCGEAEFFHLSLNHGLCIFLSAAVCNLLVKYFLLRENVKSDPSTLFAKSSVTYQDIFTAEKKPVKFTLAFRKSIFLIFGFKTAFHLPILILNANKEPWWNYFIFMGKKFNLTFTIKEWVNLKWFFLPGFSD